MKPIAFRMLGLILACIGLCAVSALAETTTVMIYICGSNLETLYHSATKDILEMRSSGFDTEQNNVVVMAGGSKEWLNGQYVTGDGISVFSFRRSHDEKTLKKTRVRGDFENASMGSAETLAGFMRYCRENYDSDRYALVLWDHGGGPLYGVCWDERFDNDHLSLEELTDALSQSPFAREKLEWIGFDACLMSSVEVASRLAPFARYMIASQAEEPASGWNYAFLKGLEGDADGASTGKRIIESYLATPQTGHPDLTLSCVDLSKIGAVEKSIDAMYAGLGAHLTQSSFSRLAKLRVKATGFGRSADIAARGMDGYDLVDAVSLSDCYSSEDGPGVEKVRAAVSEAVVENGCNIPDSCGLSLYHPYRNQQMFLGQWRDTYEKLDFCPGYTDYVSAYGRIMSGEHLARWKDLDAITAAEDGLVTLQLSPEQAENMASARLIVLAKNIYDPLDDAYFRVYSTADVAVDGELLTAVYNDTCLQILPETMTEPLTGAISYRVTEQGSYQILLYPIEPDLTRWESPIIAEYMLDDDGLLQLKSYSVYDEMTQAWSSRVELDFSTFVGFTFRNEYRIPTRNAEGDVQAFDTWTEDEHRDLQWKAREDIDRTTFFPSFALTSSSAEPLYAAYEITDTQGNTTMSALTPLNSGVEVRPVEASCGDGIPLLEPYADAYWDERGAIFGFYVQNTSDIRQNYFITDISINGIPAENAVGALNGDGLKDGLEPGEDGFLSVVLNDFTLDGIDPGPVLRRFTGNLIVQPAEGDRYFIGFTADLNLPLGALSHAEGQTGEDIEILAEDIELTLPTMEDAPFAIGCNAVVKPSRFPENSALLVNLMMSNGTQRDMSFVIDQVSINGKPVDTRTINAQGHGGLTALGRASIAPGEAGVANIVLRYDDIAAIVPDVSLRRLECRLAISAVEDGKAHFMYALPLALDMDVPLNAFYGDTETLPSRALVEAGEEIGALSAERGRLLFEHEGVSATLQGQFVVGRSLVLLLKCANEGEKDIKLFLGRATLDDRPARLGRMGNVFVTVRNNRAKVLRLPVAPWEDTPGATIELPKGQSVYSYLSISPEQDDQTEAVCAAFSAYMYDVALPTDFASIGRIEIRSEEPAPLQQGIEGVAPASDFEVSVVPEAEKGEGAALFDGQVLPPSGALPEGVPLTLELPEGERLEAGYYVIFRRVRSERELAARNILNSPEAETGGAAVSFANGREWLIYEAIGPLTPDGEGRRASAVYPCIEPVFRAGEDRMPITVPVITVEDDGAISMAQTGEIFQFLSRDYPGAALPGGTASADVRYVPAENHAELTGHKETADCDFSGAGLMIHDVMLVPADSDGDALVEFLNSDSPQTLQQILLLDGLPLTVAVEPLERPEDCCVVFFYKNTDGKICCTLPRPLRADP